MYSLNKGECIVAKAKTSKIWIVPHFIICGLFPPWIFMFIYYAIINWKTKLILTNQRLVGDVGKVFSTDHLSISLEKVDAVKVDNSFLGKIFSYSDLQVVSASGINIFPLRSNGDLFADQVMNAVEQYKEGKIASQAVATAQSLMKAKMVTAQMVAEAYKQEKSND